MKNLQIGILACVLAVVVASPAGVSTVFAAPASGPTDADVRALGSIDPTINAQVSDEEVETCYAVAAGEDVLTQVNVSTAEEVQVGSTLPADNIQSIAFAPGTRTLFASDDDQLGVLNLTTGAFSARPDTYGLAGGDVGEVQLNDVRSLGFDPTTGALYGVHMRTTTGQNDLLFRINTTTGQHVPNAFGPGDDYVVIDTPAGVDDVDDFAVNDSGTFYAVVNRDGRDERLVTVDITDGSTTDIGATDIENIEGLTFNAAGRLLGTTGTRTLGIPPSNVATNSLVEIDPTTADTTVIGALNNTDYESIGCIRELQQLQADLGVEKTVNESVVTAGEVVEFEVTVTNNGPDPATGVTIDDGITQSGLTVLGTSTSQGTYANGVWNLGSLGVGNSATLTVTVRVDQQGTYTNTAVVDTSDQPDPVPGNNSDSATVTAGERQADLGVEKTVNDSSVQVNDSVEFTVTVTNNGPDPATGVTVDDELPSCGLSYIAHTASAGTTYDSTTGLWTVNDLSVGESATLTIVARAEREGTLENVAAINESDQPDPNDANNEDNATVTARANQTPVCTEGVQVGDSGGGGDVGVGDGDDGATAQAGLTVTAPETVAVGDDLRIDYTLTNAGGAAADAAVIRLDQLPDGVGVDAIDSPESDALQLNARSVSFTDGLPVGQSKTASFLLNLSDGLQPGDTVTVAATGVLYNGSTQTQTTASVTVEVTSDIPQQYRWADTNDNGDIDFQEVLAVISAFNEGQTIGDSGPISFGDVLELLTLFNEGV